MTDNNELEIIAHIRSEVMGHKELTGENLFLAWGYPTAIVLFLEFAALMIWNEDWCIWLWAGIPLICTPLMIYFLNEDYERTRHRTLDQNVILLMWIFIGFASCVGGAAMGFAGVFKQCYCAFQGMLVGMGCFMTGIILHFRPKTVCGIIASLLSVVPLFFQGDLWPWQLLFTSAITVIALIIPGHLFHHYVRHYYKTRESYE
jgi:hypothetical protein